MTIKMVNPTSGRDEYVPTGFSWTSLFFGVFVPMCRGDMATAIIAFALIFFTAGFGVLVVWPYLMFFYNGQYLRALEDKGWVSADRYEALKAAGKAV